MILVMEMNSVSGLYHDNRYILILSTLISFLLRYFREFERYIADLDYSQVGKAPKAMSGILWL